LAGDRQAVILYRYIGLVLVLLYIVSDLPGGSQAKTKVIIVVIEEIGQLLIDYRTAISGRITLSYQMASDSDEVLILGLPRTAQVNEWDKALCYISLV